MGFIAQLASKAEVSSQGRETWERIFGTSKEDRLREGSQKPVPGGSYGRSAILSSDPAMKRLLQAMRSTAPGGWSDDRWAENRNYYGITYLAINRQNELLSQSEFQVFIKDPAHQDGKRPVTPDDPPQNGRQAKPYDLVRLLEKPNPEDSFGDLLENYNLQMSQTGMSLNWFVPNAIHQPHPDPKYDGCGYPMEIYPIPTSIAVPQPVINTEYPYGFWRIQPVYPYGPFSSFPTPYSSVGAPIDARWMMRIKYPHPILRYDGYSPMTGLNMHIDEVNMMDRSRHASMRRGINPSAYLSFEESEGLGQLPEAEIERIRTEWENNFQGAENAGKLIVGSPGSKLEEWGQRPVDMDYQAGWDQLTSFILAGYGITKPAAGMIEESSYASLYATMKQLYWQTLEPKVDRFARKITRQIAPFFGDNLIVEIRCKRIDDHEIHLAKMNFLKECKAITKNDALKEMDFPMTKEEWGEDIVGDPSPKEAEQQQQEQQQGGMPGMGGLPGQEGQPALPEQATHEEEQPAEIEQSRPSPGKLSEGSRNPLKNFEHRRKSFYDQVTKVCLNGTGKH